MRALGSSLFPRGDPRTYSLYVCRRSPPPLNTTTVDMIFSFLAGQTVHRLKRKLNNAGYEEGCAALAFKRDVICAGDVSVCSLVYVFESRSKRTCCLLEIEDEYVPSRELSMSMSSLVHEDWIIPTSCWEDSKELGDRAPSMVVRS